MTVELYQSQVSIHDPHQELPRRLPSPGFYSPMSPPKVAPTRDGAVLVDGFDGVAIIGADDVPRSARLPEVGRRVQPQSQQGELPVSSDGELLARLSWNAPPPDASWDRSTRVELIHLPTGKARPFELPGRAFRPAWSADGSRVAIAASTGRIHVLAARALPR